ncbi:hypothetical protein CRYUN_Cryun14cG0098100 [Craigia yunnanensis]
MAGPRGTLWAVGAGMLEEYIDQCHWEMCWREDWFLNRGASAWDNFGVEGVLPGQAKLFDTPGLLQPHQMTSRLTREEQKLVYVSKELKPRTYRIKAGNTVHIAGLIRLDIEESSVESKYVTVWASPYLPLRMGKTENAQRILKDRFGHQLQVCILVLYNVALDTFCTAACFSQEERVEELGSWVRKKFHVSGNSWDSSSVDIAAAGVDFVLSNVLIPDRAQLFEEAGLRVSKIVSKAEQNLNKSQKQSEKKKQGDQRTAIAAEF